MTNAHTAGLEGYLDIEERDSQSLHKGTLRDLIGFILRYKKYLFAGIGIIFLSTSAVLLEPRLLGFAIDDGIIPKRWDKLKMFTIIFFMVECVRVLATIGHAYLFEVLGQRVMQELRIALFSQLQKLPISTYDKNPVGRLVTRVTNDISSLAEMFSAGFVTMFGNGLIVVGILVWLIVLNPKLGIITACVFPLLVAASVYFSMRLRIAYRNARSRLSSLNAFLAENILGMRIIHLFNRQKLHLERFDRVNQWYANAQVGTISVYALFQPTITICSGAAVALLIWFGGEMTLTGELKLGVLVAYFSYALSLFQPMREIADKWNIFLSGMASAERIFAVMNWKSEFPDQIPMSAVKALTNVKGHIVFDKVWFAYDTDRWVLKDFSFEIKPGMKVGVVGHTGAGKTTLINVLLRFYEFQKGRILLDGKDIREFDKRSLRASFGVIQQDGFLFSGSIWDNITLWRDIDEHAHDAVKAVLSEFGLNRRLDSVANELQERGTNLSMGERQVLAFARACAASPSSWVLDEATASIDSGSEKKREVKLNKFSRQSTAILIAHRLATVRNTDVILVLHKGTLVESGTHRALMHENGLYARLYRLQEHEANPVFA